MDIKKALVDMEKTAREAGKLILEIYETDFAVEVKSDDSPVTAADKTSDAFIRERLSSLYPEAAFLTEESGDDPSRLKKEWVYIVDPLDGTSDFVNHDGEFAVLIALVHFHEVVAGVIYSPTLDLLYSAIRGEGAYKETGGKKERIHVSDRVGNSLRLLISKTHFNEKEKDYIAARKSAFTSIEPRGAAIKFGLIAEGKADVSYRFSPFTKEWDVAPGSLILEEAGGYMLKPDGTAYSFNRPDVYNREGYFLLNKKENLDLPIDG